MKANCKLTPSLLADFEQKAAKPHYSYLLNTKLPPMRSWQEMLSDYFSTMEK